MLENVVPNRGVGIEEAHRRPLPLFDCPVWAFRTRWRSLWMDLERLAMMVMRG